MSRAILGHDVDTGAPVVVQDEDRQRGLYIIGTTGTGKTTLLESLALQDMQSGLGLCVLDPHGDLVNRLVAQLPLDRAADVVLLDPRDAQFPFGLNPYWCDDPKDTEIVGRQAAHVSELFEKLWGSQGSEGTSWGPRVAQFIRNTAFTLLENPGLTMAHIPSLLTDAGFRREAVANVTNPQVRLFWENYDRLKSAERQLERADSTLNKLDEFLTQPIVANIVGQRRSTVDFRSFMDEGKIVLVPLGLGRLGEPVVSLLGSLIVLQILNAALSRENQANRRQFNLYADEYQRFATPAFATLLTEARKYGVATTIAHQIRAQLDPHTRAAALNAGNIVVFAVHGEDGEELAKQFDRTPPEATTDGRQQKLTNSPQPVQDLVRFGHEDERVRKITSSLLSPLVNATSLPEGRLRVFRYQDTNANFTGDWTKYFFDEGAYYVSSLTCKEGVELINNYLVNVTENRFESVEDVVHSVTNILIKLRAFFGLATYEEPAFAGPSRKYVPGERTDLRQIGWIPEMGEAQLRLLVLAVLLGNPEAVHEAIDFGERRRVFWEAHMETLMGWRDSPDVVKKMSTRRAAFESSRAEQAAQDLVHLADILHKNPVLVASGQWESRLEKPRTYADVEAEIASRLVNQPQFHAWCKIAREGAPLEFRIKGPSWIELQDEAHRFSGLSAIQARSRNLYCRPRPEVEEEMRTRPRPQDDPPPTSRVVDI